ncbi:hypothetical protein GDO81_001255 [Engystomops pustulosus]|uniref:Secreted protein n=1 Tax=Engystomops pustulosus TaxID=76066 RepID=A0AAV7DBQ4_ENGPU|nr:hypothetical protein GDO81_001255 [Engystomops pustulosus]
MHQMLIFMLQYVGSTQLCRTLTFGGGVPRCIKNVCPDKWQLSFFEVSKYCKVPTVVVKEYNINNNKKTHMKMRAQHFLKIKGSPKTHRHKAKNSQMSLP